MSIPEEAAANRGRVGQRLGPWSHLALWTLFFALLILAILLAGIIGGYVGPTVYFINMSIAGLGVGIIASRRTGGWTLIFAIVVATLIVSGNHLGITGLLAHVVLIAIAALAVGVFVGSAPVPHRMRRSVAFIVGSFGTVFGSVIAVGVIVSIDPEPLEIIPLAVALTGGLLGIAAGALCALGATLGGVLRRRVSALRVPVS